VAKDTKVADLIRREKAGAELTTAEKSLVEAQRKAQDCWWEGGFIETPKPAEKPVVSTEIPTTVPPAALSKPTTPESGAMSRSQKTMDVIKLRQNLETLVADGKIKSETANEIISALNESGSFNEARLKAIRSKLGPANRLVNAAIEASRASETPTENARGNLRIENVNGVEVAVQQPAATSEPGAPSEFNAALRASGGRLRFGLIPKGSQRVAPRVKRGNAPDSPTRGFSRVDFVDVNSAVLDHHQRTGENVCATDLVIRPETIEAIRNGSSERRMLVAHEKPDVDSIASTTLFMMIRNGEIKGNEAAVKRLVDYTHNEDLLVWDAPTASGEHANLAYLLDLISGKIGSSSLSQNILQYEVGYEIIKRIIQKNLDPTHLRLADFLDMQGNPLSFATKKYGLNSAIEKAIGNMLGQNAKKFIDSIRQILPDILNGNNRLFNELCNKMAIDPDVARQLSVLLNDRQNITVTQGEPVRIETFLAEGGSGKPSAYEAWRNKHFEKFEKLIAGGKNQFTLPALPNGEVPKGLYDPSGKVLEPAEIYRRGFSVIFSGKTVWLRPDYAESPGAKERLVQAFRELERAETAERKRLYNENPGKYNRSEFLREGKVRPGYEGYGPEEGGNSNPWGHGADHSYLVQPSGSNRSVLPNEVIQNIIMHGLNITNSTF
jgi:hypothetical protein